MHVTRSTPVALVMIALAASTGGAQAPAQQDASAVYKKLSMFVYPAKGQSAPSEGQPAPYHGYVYRMLFSQGPAANGGARDYVVDGKLTGGFALLAYPAEYGQTGVMTLMVSQDGIVWQRDLGDKTAELAAAITRFDPDRSWTPIAPNETIVATQP